MTEQKPASTPTRREMLRRAGAAGLAFAGVAAGAVYFGRRPGWPPPSDHVALPDWRTLLVDGKPELVVVRGGSPTARVLAALEEMGGISRFIEPGDRVLVKPNAAFDRPAWQGATANPDVVGAIVAACTDAGASEVIVTDNPIHAPEGCFRKSGIGRASEDAGGKVLLPRDSAFRPVALPGTLLDGWPVYATPLLRATKVIGIAPVKDHNLARASLTMKNWYGLLTGPRNRLHQRMDETIATLGRMVRPTLSVLDGTRIMIRNGPTGGSPDDLIEGDVLAMGTDNVGLDAFGAELLSIDPRTLLYLQMAEAEGSGTIDFRSLPYREIDA